MSAGEARAAAGRGDSPVRGVSVLKIGGSLERSPLLRAWLEALGALASPVVVVPGGGRFADQVRAAQAAWHFDDGSAHRMALLAMEQFGLLMTALQPALRPAGGERDIAAALAAGRVPVWMPSAAVLADPAVTPSWSVTSDSLAARLAFTLRAERLILVKSLRLPGGAVPVRQLVAQGVVDAAFAEYGVACAPDIWLLGKDQVHELPALLRGAAAAATRVLADP